MKFTATFKTPDALDQAIEVAATNHVAAANEVLSDEGRDTVDELVAKTSGDVKKWVEYGEYISIEFDTDAGTATVLRQN